MPLRPTSSQPQPLDEAPEPLPGHSPLTRPIWKRALLTTAATLGALGAWHSTRAQEPPGENTGSALTSASDRVPSTPVQLAQVEPRVVPPDWPNRRRPVPLPRPLPPSLGQELRLVSQEAKVRIDDAAARTTLTQTFENTTGRTIEGTYLFPLPQGAAVSNFAMMVNGKRVEAEILERDKAREIYQGIVNKMRDPAILEFTDRNLLRARIFPIPAGDKPRVELTYSEALKPDGGQNGSFRFVLPLKLPVGGSADKATVDVEIVSKAGLRGVFSPTHRVEVARDPANGSRARVTGEFSRQNGLTEASTSTSSESGRSDRDFVLYFATGGARVGVSPIVFQNAGEDPFFMLLVAPDSRAEAREVAAKDVVFVCDTSGSMDGEKIVQARNALRNLVGLLNAGDRFNIVTFSSDVRTFRDDMLPASAANVEAAKSWVNNIKAVGGTNINDSLVEALKQFEAAQNSRPRQIVFMTDGQPTVGETDIAQILKNVRAANSSGDPGPEALARAEAQKARLFVFGVGYDVNTRLLDTLAEDNSGSSDYVLPEEDIESKVGALYRKIAFPVLAAPKLDWGGAKVYDVYPRRLPDLFRGTQAVVFGRIEGAFQPGARVQLTGLSGGVPSRVQGDSWGSGDSRNDALPRLWAARKIGFLLDDSRLHNRPIAEEVRAEVVKLSKKYGIVTPLTAALITEDTPGFPGATARTQFGIGGSMNDAGAGGFGGSFRRRSAARGSAMDAAESMAKSAPQGSLAAAAPSLSAQSGAGAVAASKAKRAMKEAERVGERSDVRFVGGKSFFEQNGKWIDTTFDAAKSPKPERIAFGSDAYWKLLGEAGKISADLPKWLSLGDSVLIALPARTIEIVPAAK